MKQTIKVVGAAIVREGKVLALRRRSGIDSVKHKFEFVGGKIQDGESPEEALKRECLEELSLKVKVGELLNRITYDYPEYMVDLSIYFCTAMTAYELREHEEEKWIDCEALDPEEWAPADQSALGVLKKGYLRITEAKSEDDFALIGRLGAEVMHETFDKLVPDGQTDYMLNMFLSVYAIKNNVSKRGYEYKLVSFNGETAGFYAYCPAHEYDPSRRDGVFLSKLYLAKFAQGKKIASRVFASLPRPVLLTVKKDNAHAINVYKHCGFRIVSGVMTDIGSGYVMDDFLMELN